MELEELRRISARSELSLNFVAKDEMISAVLSGMQGFDDIILKGGTAVNRVYVRDKRFSEDIDFDLIFNGTPKEAISRTKEIVDRLKGFKIPRPRLMKQTIRYDLFYTNPLDHQDRIMIEFRVINKPEGDFEKKIVNFGFVPHDPALLNVYCIEAIISQKIECIMNRIEGKDFLDLCYLIELPHKKLKTLTQNKEKILQRAAMEEAQIKTAANIINHYIPRNQRPQWGMFLEELKEKIKGY